MVLFGGRGCAWFYSGGACVVLFGGGMRGFIWGGVCGFIWGGMRGFIWGACMVLFGGMRGFIRGACAWFYLGGKCMVLFGGHVHGFIWGGMHGFIWGGMCGFIRGVCMVLFGGPCMVLFGGGVHGFIWGGVHGFFSFFRYNEIRSMSGWYASYWNAFLFQKHVSRILFTGGFTSVRARIPHSPAGTRNPPPRTRHPPGTRHPPPRHQAPIIAGLDNFRIKYILLCLEFSCMVRDFLCPWNWLLIYFNVIPNRVQTLALQALLKILGTFVWSFSF